MSLLITKHGTHRLSKRTPQTSTMFRLAVFLLAILAVRAEADYFLPQHHPRPYQSSSSSSSSSSDDDDDNSAPQNVTQICAPTFNVEVNVDCPPAATPPLSNDSLVGFCQNVDECDRRRREACSSDIRERVRSATGQMYVTRIIDKRIPTSFFKYRD